MTRLKVKGNLIEFQLDGGGYGTAGDPTVSVQSMPKTQREKDLEQAVKKETDPTLKRRLQGELDGLRSEREREDRLLGAPTRTSDRKEGTLSVKARTYDTASGRVVAEFVEGVLVRFTITSR